MRDDAQGAWREISECLDAALELAGPEREGWLRSLGEQRPEIERAVRSLLDEQQRLPDDLLKVPRSLALPRLGLAGQQLGAYTLESPLGHGGMGTVWLARRSDGRYEGDAAVKLLNASLIGHPAEQRFVREGSMLARLKHPNIAQLIDAGVAPTGQPYLVLEYVDGERIDAYADRKQLDTRARVRLFIDVLTAVSHAHRHLIIHRDLKPTNILVTEAGVVKLLDFGIATLIGPQDDELTREAVGLTPGYAAPEQLLDDQVTTATDVYALGMMLFVLLAGRHPLEPSGRSRHELAQATLECDMPLMSQTVGAPALARTLRGDLDSIVARALRRDPAQRYSNVDALASDLRSFLANAPVSARPDTLIYRINRFVRRHRAAVGASAATLLLLLGSTAFAIAQMLDARKQRDEAVFQSQRAEFQARFAYHIMAEVGDDGQPITIRQLMAKGMDVLERNYRDDPRFVIGMLVNISGRYMDLGDTNGELEALTRAERIARQMGDPERIAYVQCNTVETELAAANPQKARERLQEGLALLATLPTRSFRRQGECEAAQARLLWSEGRLPEAIDTAANWARQIEARQETDDLLYSTLASMLDVMLSLEGRRAEAREWNAKLIEALQRSGGESTLGMSTAQHHRAGHLFDAGEWRAALEVQQAIVDAIVAQQGVDAVNASYAHRLGLLQILVDGKPDGLVWIDRAVADAATHNNYRGHIGALLSRAQAQLALGDLTKVRADIEKAEALAQQLPNENRAGLRSARLLRARLALAEGEPAQARQAVQGALDEIGYPAQRVANQLAPMLIVRAQADLALGNPGAALETAQDALEIARANAPQPDVSAHVGEALLTLAAANRALGDSRKADAAAADASRILSRAIGPDHSKVSAAVRLP